MKPFRANVPDEARATNVPMYVSPRVLTDALSSLEMRCNAASMLYLKIRTLRSNRDLEENSGPVSVGHVIGGLNRGRSG